MKVLDEQMREAHKLLEDAILYFQFEEDFEDTLE